MALRVHSDKPEICVPQVSWVSIHMAHRNVGSIFNNALRKYTITPKITARIVVFSFIKDVEISILYNIIEIWRFSSISFIYDIVLQSLQASDGTIKDVTQKMFKIISPPPEDKTPRQNQCRKCAVVGNSGNLLRSKYGALIDSHSTVIRYVFCSLCV